MERNQVYCMDALDFLKGLDDESVNCIVTSPPYYGLRDYGIARQYGLEATPREYVDKLVTLFREARRVLRSDGTFFLNIGDSFSGNGAGGQTPIGETGQRKGRGNDGLQCSTGRVEGLPAKNLLMIPARVAIALQDDGWILRSEIIWAKRNPMPESVTDRPTRAHEMVYMLTKAAHYWYDADAIAEPASYYGKDRRSGKGRTAYNGKYDIDAPQQAFVTINETRNKRDVWWLASEPTSEAHFATFPQKLIEPMILAGCPPFGVVLDMFMGSGTTALVARRLGRDYIGSELNPAYIDIIDKRLCAPFMVDVFEFAARKVG